MKQTVLLVIITMSLFGVSLLPVTINAQDGASEENAIKLSTGKNVTGELTPSLTEVWYEFSSKINHSYQFILYCELDFISLKIYSIDETGGSSSHDSYSTHGGMAKTTITIKTELTRLSVKDPYTVEQNMEFKLYVVDNDASDDSAPFNIFYVVMTIIGLSVISTITRNKIDKSNM